MADICWENKEQGEKLTNKQLKLYLKQIGHKVSGNKTQLVERVLSHARGSRTLEIECLMTMMIKARPLTTARVILNAKQAK